MAESGYMEPTAQVSWDSGYPELFYSVLFHPIQTFKAIAVEKEPGPRLLLYALLSVVLVSAAAPIIQLSSTGGSPIALAVAIPISTLIGVFVWAFVALVIAMLSYAFSGQTCYRTFFVLSGLATLPWLFMAPASLLKVGIGAIGVILCAVLGLCIWLWSVLLFAQALVVTYSMTAERVMILLAMPFVMTLIFCGWIFGFFNNIGNLVPH